MAKDRKPKEAQEGQLRIEYAPLAELVPAEANPKGHDLTGIQESIRRFGFGDPVVVDERTGRLLEGHGRREALLALLGSAAPVPEGIRELADGAWLVPVVRGFRTKSDAEAEAYLVAHNHLSEKGGWDERGLFASLQRIRDAGASFDGTGFGEADLDRLRALAQAVPAAPLERQDGERGPTPSEYRPGWEASQLRQVTLIMPAHEYEWALSCLERVRAARSLESNTDAVLALLGDAAPDLPRPAAPQPAGVEGEGAARDGRDDAGAGAPAAG